MKVEAQEIEEQMMAAALQVSRDEPQDLHDEEMDKLIAEYEALPYLRRRSFPQARRFG